MASNVMLWWLVSSLVVSKSWGNPVGEGLPLTIVSELTSRLGPHTSRLQEARLPIPTPQDLEAIKKVAQILVMLGEQVIPAILGEPQSSAAPEPITAGVDVPNDSVTLDKLPIST